MDKIKTLGDAIRVGSKMKPQCYELLVNFNPSSTCAIGAAMEGIGQNVLGLKTEECSKILSKKFNIDRLAAVESPVMSYSRTGSLFSIIEHLNDYCRWTREKIADWADEQLGQKKENFILDKTPNSI